MVNAFGERIDGQGQKVDKVEPEDKKEDEG